MKFKPIWSRCVQILTERLSYFGKHFAQEHFFRILNTVSKVIFKIDKTILCADGEQNLVDLKHWDERTKVYQLSFHPDVPIETFFDTMASPILTKGSKIK